jgi:hypothetical protein
VKPDEARVDLAVSHLSLRWPAPIAGYIVTYRTCRVKTRTALLKLNVLTGPSWSRRYFTTDSQNVLVSSTLVGLVTRYYFLSECCCLKFAVLYLWGALSDEMTGLQFAVQSLNGPSHAESVTILYCLIWDSPNLEGQVPVFISSRNRVAQLYPWALGSLYIVSYDSQGYSGGILTLPLPGGTGPCIYSLQE